MDGLPPSRHRFGMRFDRKMAPVRDFVRIRAIASSHLFIVLDCDVVPLLRNRFVAPFKLSDSDGVPLSRHDVTTEAHPPTVSRERDRFGFGGVVRMALFMVGYGKVGSWGFDFVPPSSRFAGGVSHFLRLVDITLRSLYTFPNEC